MHDYRIPQLDVNTGVLERGAGDLTSAVRYLQLGLDGDDSDPLAWSQLAAAQEQAGRIPEAAETWRRASVRLPSDLSLRQQAMRFRRRHAQR